MVQVMSTVRDSRYLKKIKSIYDRKVVLDHQIFATITTPLKKVIDILTN
jgi:hypothetical protein